MKTKKADSKYLSIWWFFILAIILGGIIIMVSSVNSSLDMRELEAEILNEKVIDCIINNGEINNNFLNDNFDIFEKCLINKEIVNNSGIFYLEINLYKIENCFLNSGTGKVSCSNSIVSKFFGVKDFKTQCSIINKNEKFAKCSLKQVYSLDDKGNRYLFEIFSGSNQFGKIGVSI